MGTSANTSNMAYIPATAHAQLAAYAIWDFLTRSGAPAHVVLLYLGAETGLGGDLSSLSFCLGYQLLRAPLIVQLNGVRPFVIRQEFFRRSTLNQVCD